MLASMDAIAGKATDFAGHPTDLKETGDLCVDTGPMHMASIVPTLPCSLDLGGVQSISTADPTPFGGVELAGANDITARTLAAAEADQYFGPSYATSDQVGGMDRTAFDRCQSAPVRGIMDFTPIHIKTQEQQDCEKEAAAGCNGTESGPLLNSQSQVMNPLLRRLASESSVSMARGCYDTQLQGNSDMMKQFLRHNGSAVNPGLPTPSQQAMLLTHQSGNFLDSTLSGFGSTWMATDGLCPVPQVNSLPRSRSDRVHPKSRWKPSAAQLCLLEQHFNSGYTKPTPELFAAVQAVGHATEAQVSVWLKNRMSRCKNKVQESQSAGPDAPEDGSPTNGRKREREEEAWDDFGEVFGVVIEELSSIAATICPAEIKALAQAIKEARHVCCYGVGREGLVMRALASNLHHLGFSAYFIGDVGTPAIGDTDLFLVSAGPSYYSSVSALSLEAMRASAKVIAFTAHKTADLPFAKQVIRIPSQTLPPCIPIANGKMGPMGANAVSFLPGGKWSIMHMGASYELSLWLMLECVAIMLRKKCRVESSEMRVRHTNLE